MTNEQRAAAALRRLRAAITRSVNKHLREMAEQNLQRQLLGVPRG